MYKNRIQMTFEVLLRYLKLFKELSYHCSLNLNDKFEFNL